VTFRKKGAEISPSISIKFAVSLRLDVTHIIEFISLDYLFKLNIKLDHKQLKGYL